MKVKFIYFLLICTLFIGCSAYKEAENKLNKGDYSSAFETSLKVFFKNSSQKKKDKQLILLQTSYLKANEEDLRKLEYNQRQSDFKSSYLTLKELYNRNNSIKPLLPLYHNGKELSFPVKDYTFELNTAKEKYLNQYYSMALDLLNSNDKNKARRAYEYFTEIKGVDKYYKDVNNLQMKAFDLGADIIYVTTENETGVPIPENFRDNLLHSLNSSVRNFWTQITTNPSDPRDFMVNVKLKQAVVGNDIVTTNQYNYEKDIVDGWQYLEDGRGNLVKDSIGNRIKVDRHIQVYARVTEYVRHKEALISADIQIYNSLTGSMVDRYPVTSNFAFNASFATIEGDDRALNSDVLRLVRTPPAPFPDNYDMINQCGMELKKKLIDILNSFN